MRLEGKRPGLRPGRPRGVLRAGFCRRRRRGPAGHRAQRRRQILAAADGRRAGPDRRRAAGAGRRRPRQDHPRAGPLPRPPGRAEAVADGRRKPRVLGPLSRRRRSRRRRALAAVGLAALADLPAAYLSAGQRRRLSLARLLAVPRPIWLLDEPTSALDREAQDMLAGLMQQHLAGGGLIIAATHGPIGLDRAKELRLGRAPHEPARGAVHARHPPRRPRRRRRRHRRAVLPDRGGADAVRDRPRPRAARPHRPGDPVARRAAREPADARPAVRRRPRGRLARPDPDGRARRSNSRSPPRPPRTGSPPGCRW